MLEEKTLELEQKLEKTVDPLYRVKLMNELAFQIRHSNLERSIEISKKSQEIAAKIKDQNGLATSLNNEAFCYVQKTEYELALEKSFQALDLFESINNELGIAQVHYNFCIIYIRLSDFQSALESINKSLKYYKKENNVSELARCYYQIGHLYRSLNDLDGAIEYLINSITLNQEINNKAGEGASFMALGLTYLKQKDYEKSRTSLITSLSLQEEINDKRGYAASLNAFVSLCMESGDFLEAEKASMKGIKLAKELSDKMGIARFMVDLGKLYFKQGKTEIAEVKTQEALEIADSINLKMAIAPAHKLLSEIFQKKGEYKKALEHHQFFFKVNEEMVNANVAMKAKSDEFVKKIENAQTEAEINRLKNVELKSALDEIEEKNKEITASITYALRIQTAMLPPQKYIQQHLPNSFIYYQPKDIVAGDFYWAEKVNDNILFAACDCTGHGVPGAMVSVVCHNALNRAVREFKLIEPAAILSKTSEIVIENFSKSEENIKDGMDISLCSYNSKTKTIEWAGANNPIWIIQKNELIEVKGNKQPIGSNDNKSPFTNHKIQLFKGDTIYLFTDGYADQFGGEANGKKLTKKRFRELLLSIQAHSLNEQGNHLKKFIENYRGNIDQTDDILVIGLKI